MKAKNIRMILEFVLELEFVFVTLVLQIISVSCYGKIYNFKFRFFIEFILVIFIVFCFY